MRFDYKNISIGFFIGVICTVITFLLIGDVEIETDLQFGDKGKNIFKLEIWFQKIFIKN